MHQENQSPQPSNDESEDNEELFCNDIYQLSNHEFISKYSTSRSSSYDFTCIPTDVLCFIILQYLDWKTVFQSCLLVNKDFYRKIANNRQLFINLYNELFVMKKEEIESLTLESPAFKHKRIFTGGFSYDTKLYGGLLYPNEHYHFCEDYEYCNLDEKGFQTMKRVLERLYIKNCTMTEQKLMLIKKTWENSVSILRKNNSAISSAPSSSSRRLKKNENQALLALIKKIIKDRLFMRKYFNHELKSKYFGKRSHHYYYYTQHMNRKEAIEFTETLPDVTQQLEEIFYYADCEQYQGYQWYELEEIVLGHKSTFNGVAIEFLNFMEPIREDFPLNNIVSLFCRK